MADRIKARTKRNLKKRFKGFPSWTKAVVKCK